MALDNKSLVSSANYLTDLNSTYSKAIVLYKNNVLIPNGINHTIEATVKLCAEKAKADLADAQAQVKAELDAAKAQAAQLIEQANRRAAQLVEEARTQASAEGERIRQQAKETVDQDINAAREELRQQVAALAVAGAEKILNQQVDAEAHNAMLNQLAAKL